MKRTKNVRCLLILLFCCLWTSYCSWNCTIQTVLVFYKKCCRVLTKRTFFYNCICMQVFRTLYFALAWPFLHFFTNVQCHIIKKLTDLNRSGNTGKYPTSVLLYLSRYRSVNTASPRLDISPYCPHSRSVSCYYYMDNWKLKHW